MARIRVDQATEEKYLHGAMVDAARALEEAKRAKELADLAFAEAEERYITAAFAAKTRGVPTAKVPFTATNGIEQTATLVDGTGGNSVLDEGMFRNKIGAKVWHTLTKEVLDKAKLDAALTTGAVDRATVVMCTKVGDKKSFARFTPVKGQKVTKVMPVKRVTAVRRVAS